MKEITLIRHAEAESHILNQKVIAGRCNYAELTPSGLLQAAALRTYHLQNNITYARVIPSPAVRTQQTARYGLVQQADTPDAAFIEISQGDWEGKPRSEVHTDDLLRKMNQDPWFFAAPNGESQEQVYLRARNRLEQVVEEIRDGERVAIVTHEYVIKFLLTGLLNLDTKRAYKLPVHNASITRVAYDNGEWRELVRNDTSHLSLVGLASAPSRYEKD